MKIMPSPTSLLSNRTWRSACFPRDRRGSIKWIEIMKSSTKWIWEIVHMVYLYAGEWKVIFNSDSLLQLAMLFCKYLPIWVLNSLFSDKLSLKYSIKYSTVKYCIVPCKVVLLFPNVKLFTHIFNFFNKMSNLMVR